MKHLGLKQRIFLVAFSLATLCAATMIVLNGSRNVHNPKGRTVKEKKATMDKKTGKTKKISVTEIQEEAQVSKDGNNKVGLDDKVDFDKPGMKGEDIDQVQF